MRLAMYLKLGTMITATFFIFGCSNSGVLDSNYSESSNIPSSQIPSIEQEEIEEIPTFQNSFSNIEFMYYEKDKNYYYDIIHSIEPEFMNKLRIIEIYNPENTMYYWKGLFIPPDKIKINDFEGNFKYQLLHELIHLDCYGKNNDIGHNYCFYHNPIQDDYKGEFGVICGNNECKN